MDLGEQDEVLGWRFYDVDSIIVAGAGLRGKIMFVVENLRLA